MSVQKLKPFRVRVFLSVEYDADPANYPPNRFNAGDIARIDWERIGPDAFTSVADKIVFRGAEEVVERACGLCMDDKPCNFENCPEDPANG